MIVELGVVLAYLLVALIIGVLAYRVTTRSAEDYYLASRSMGTVVLLFTTFATLLSAFTFFGGPNVAYGAGPEWILVMGLMDGVLFGVLWYLLGYKQWLAGRAHGYVTLGEMLGDRFGSTGLRGLVAVVSLFWLFPYVMLQQMGAGTALVALTDGGVQYWQGALLVTVFMVAYVAAAGMRGVAWTDTLQGVFMLGMVWAAFAWVATTLGGPVAATEQMIATNPDFGTLGGGLYTPQYVISTAVSIAFGVTMFPQVNQRFFVGRSETVLKRSFVLWPVLCILLFVPAFLVGSWAISLDIVVPDNANVLPIVLNAVSPGWFAALVVAGALAAMMSSSDSMLLSGSSYVTRDLYRPFVNPDASERTEDTLGRAAVAVFAFGAFLASLTRPGTLVSVGSTAFSGFAQLALPVALALYWRNTTRTGIIAGVAGSQVFYLATIFAPELVVSGVPIIAGSYYGWGSGVVGMLVGLLLTIGVSLVTTTASTEDATLLFETLGTDN